VAQKFAELQRCAEPEPLTYAEPGPLRCAELEPLRYAEPERRGAQVRQTAQTRPY
jgi:hypothetical protein